MAVRSIDAQLRRSSLPGLTPQSMLPRGRMDTRVKPAHDDKRGSVGGGSAPPLRLFAAQALLLWLPLTGERSRGRAGACGGRTGRLAAADFMAPPARPCYAGARTRSSSCTPPISWARTLMVSSPSTGAERHTMTSPGLTGLTPSGVPV
jgi:hypothetical protein